MWSDISTRTSPAEGCRVRDKRTSDSTTAAGGTGEAATQGRDMSRIFDSLVYARRRHTPWSRMSLLDFAKDVCLRHLEKPAIERCFELRVFYREDVVSKFWFDISWTGPTGEQLSTCGESLDLALYRAAETEIQAQRLADEERRSKKVSSEKKRAAG